MKNLFTLLISISFTQILFAQFAPGVEWSTCLGGSGSDQAVAAIQTLDGGFFIAGNTTSNDGQVSGNHGLSDVWLARINSSGNFGIQKCFGGSGNDYCEDFIKTSDGGYALLGTTYSNDGDVSGNHGSIDIWVIKLSASCNIQWQKCLGGSSYDFGESIIEDTDGNLVIAGNTRSNNGDVSELNSEYDAWVIKLEPDGDILWEQTYYYEDETEHMYDIIETSDGNYLMVGYILWWVGSGYAYQKIDKNGNSIWISLYGLIGEPNYAKSVVESPEGIYKVVGNGFYEILPPEKYGFNIVDSSGTFLPIGGDLSENDPLYSMGNCISKTSDGNVVIAGDRDVNIVCGGYPAGKNFTIAKVDTLNNTVWETCIGGSSNDYANFITETSDEGLIAVGYTYSTDNVAAGNHGGSDMLIVKFANESYFFADTDNDGYGDPDEIIISEIQPEGYVLSKFLISESED